VGALRDQFIPAILAPVYIRLILDKTGGNHSQAARMLGIDRRTLYRRLSEMENDRISE
jgi:DNA-binding NtrC family response regulator